MRPRDPAEVSAAIAELVSAWGSVDILVNNAGVAYYGPTEKMTSQQWDWLLAINLLAPIQMTRELLPVLLQRPVAHVLNVCSVAGLVAGPRSAAYHVSKFGLVGFTESLRSEYGRRGVGVTALCPGPVRTNLYKAAVSGSKRKPVPVPPSWLSATPAHIAEVAVRPIQKNRRIVVITPIAHLLFNAKRFTPWFLDWLNHFTLRRRRPVNATTARTVPVLRPFEPVDAEPEAEPAERLTASGPPRRTSPSPLRRLMLIGASPIGIAERRSQRRSPAAIDPRIAGRIGRAPHSRPSRLRGRLRVAAPPRCR